MPVRQRRLPYERSRGPVERDQMSVVGDHEHLVARNRRTAVGAGNGIPHQARGSRSLIVPYLPSSARIERKAFVDVGHIHHAIGDNGSRLDTGATQSKNPLGLQSRNIGAGDLRQLAVTATDRLSVVAWPVSLRRAP